MKSAYMLILIVAFLSNTKVYMLAYSRLAEKKWRKEWIYTLAWITYAIIIILKQYTNLVLNNMLLQTLMTVIMIIYEISIVAVLYNGTWKRKLLALGVPCTVNFFLDMIALSLSVSVFHIETNDLLRISRENTVATVIESVLHICAYLLFVLLYRKERTRKCSITLKFKGTYLLPITNFITAIVLMLVLNYTSIVQKESFTQKNISFVTLLAIAIMLIVIFIDSIAILVKDTRMLKIKHNNQQLQREVNYYESKVDAYNEVKKLRHDMKNHILCVKKLFQDQCAEDAFKYLDTLYDSIEQSNDICNINHKLLSILFTEKFRKARAEGIDIKPVLFITDNFLDVIKQMSQIEQTALFTNILDNAIRAASKSQEKWIYFEISEYTTDLKVTFIHIECSNSVPNDFKFELNSKRVLKTTKQDKKNHGMGMSIIRDIVSKYGGDIEISGNSHFEMIITIPKEVL